MESRYEIRQKYRKYIKKYYSRLKEIDTKCDVIDSKHKVTIVIPFRDNKYQNRTKQLNKFISHMRPFLTKNNINILIVEQSDDGKKFNRGALLNIGSLLSFARKSKVVICHDVDLLPDQEALCYYTMYPKSPLHIANVWKGKYSRLRTFFGGVVSFNYKDYVTINGFPNDFWGWGGEDDANLIRIVKSNLPVLKATDGLITEMPHINTAIIKELINPKKKESILGDQEWKNNGLNSVKFEPLDTATIEDNISKITVRLLE